MFTSRSASARQTLPSMLGRSSNSTINSLVIGMAGPHLPALGEDRAPSRLGCRSRDLTPAEPDVQDDVARHGEVRAETDRQEESRSQVAHQRASAAPHHENSG